MNWLKSLFLPKSKPSLVERVKDVPAGMTQANTQLQELTQAKQEIRHLRTKLADDQIRRNALAQAEAQVASLQLALAGDEQRRQRLLKMETRLTQSHATQKRAMRLEELTITQAEQLSDLQQQVESLQKENTLLEARLSRPIGEPAFEFTTNARLETQFPREEFDKLWSPSLLH